MASFRELEENNDCLTKKLDDSLKEFEQFVFIASHDLNAPVRAISKLSQWLEEDTGNQLTETSVENLALLRSRVDRLERLIKDIGKLAEFTSKHFDDTERVDCERVIRCLIDKSNAYGKVVEVNSSNCLPVVNVSFIMFEIILSELIDNAIKHNTKNKVILNFKGAQDSTGFHFSITDNGPGIDKKFHEMIFKPFKGLQSKDDCEGSGIGLTLVKKLLDNNQGYIRVISGKPEQGTTIEFGWKVT
ncbi:sensor histidine kinase [Aliikangiella sp. IMCC44653]